MTANIPTPRPEKGGTVSVEEINGVTKITYCNEAGQLHRTSGPAVIYYSAEGVEEYAAYYDHGTLHRDDGPAIVRLTVQGLRAESYYRFGARHRQDGPSYVSYRPDGTVQTRMYHVNGFYHRTDGPAIEIHCGDPDHYQCEYYCEYYLNGIRRKAPPSDSE